MDQIVYFTLLLTAVFSLSACVSRQYYFVNQKKSCTEAQRYCRENYMDLATLDNKNDIEELMKSVNSNQVVDVWIGLMKTVNYKWKWSLGDPVFYTQLDSQYRNWELSQPNGSSNEDCVYMNGDGKWHNNYCTNKWSFICYNDSSKGYVPVLQTMVWRDAQSYCRANHTDLVGVRNQTENQQIQQIMNDCGINKIWIGLFRDLWEWSDQSKSSFRNWKPSEPNNINGNENGAVLTVSVNLGWQDWPCDSIHPFVCHEDKLVLIQMNVTWNEALRYCRENHVDLVSVHTEQIQRRIMNVVKKASTAAVWMGLHHYCAMNMWIWVRGEVVCYQNWAAGNGTGMEGCRDQRRVGAVQSRGDQRWISLTQTHKLNFICTNSQNF
ncbi:macrophage mannose receptor 1-like [Myxocyprinus asiaticus]|uniref:macrophage mannose receptor 1-like n=1 Tax=Myxocyprinus asiaticus TaxID=70543 RepID=UPI002221C441|nr:macrophage mannose receptor 1-like [Myxocyprinus asiaticus]